MFRKRTALAASAVWYGVGASPAVAIGGSRAGPRRRRWAAKIQLRRTSLRGARRRKGFTVYAFSRDGRRKDRLP